MARGKTERRIKFTDKGIRSMPLPEPPSQIDFWDQSLAGFGLRISYGGRRAWQVMYRRNGIKRRMSLGDYPTVPLGKARDRAKEILEAVKLGRDPAQEKLKARRADTFREVAKAYLDDYAKKEKRSWKHDERVIDKYLNPKLGTEKAFEITGDDIHAVLVPIANITSVRANRTLEIVSKMFNWAMSVRDNNGKRRFPDILANPCASLRPLQEEKSRDRELKEDEIRRLWGALATETARVQSAVKLLLMLGQREMEVLGMHTRELDGEWWEIPADRTKNGLPHRVYLPKAARLLIKEATGGADGYVFPRRNAPEMPATRGFIAGPFTEIRESAGLPDVWIHDLRRTMASRMTEIGIPRLVVSMILNHADKSVTGVYDRYAYADEKRNAMNRWAERLQEIANKKEEEV